MSTVVTQLCRKARQESATQHAFDMRKSVYDSRELRAIAGTSFPLPPSLQDISREFPRALDVGAHAGHVYRAICEKVPPWVGRPVVKSLQTPVRRTWLVIQGWRPNTKMGYTASLRFAVILQQYVVIPPP